MYKQKGKNSIWIYAIILFSCTIALLLFTGYSQSKLNSSLEDYRNKLIDSEEEKSISRHSLSSALEENQMLYEKIENFLKELEEKSNQIKELDKKILDANNQKNESINNYELLLEVEEYYNRGEIMESAIMLLKKIDIDKLNLQGKDKYNDLFNIVSEKASWKFYKEGYNNYINKRYEEAKSNLYLSLELTKDAYYSDDCYFYIAYSDYRLGNHNLATESLNLLILKYPLSNYLDEAKNLLKIIENYD
ncbi:UNVERIFIED_CONTAM: hypothetical protein Cloal_1139 [Acetivibrio alkalicellulosi]